MTLALMHWHSWPRAGRDEAAVVGTRHQVRLVVLVLAAAFTVAVHVTTLAGPARANAASAGISMSPVDDSVVWLCRPGAATTPCRSSMATTIQSHDEPDRTVSPNLPAKPPVDCFYVYPTVSDEPTPNSSKFVTPQVKSIAEYQAARFSLACDVYAPVYRQRTVPAAAGQSAFTPEQRAEFFRIAYGDVAQAWREYLARDNQGRGVVFIGHSQGARILRKLLREEVDPHRQVRERMVSAIVLGANVLVRKGSVVGGDFRSIPLCRNERQIGCVVAWSTFNETPPDNTAYGRSPAGDPDGMGLPYGPEYEVACTNPTSLRANARRPATTILRTEPFVGSVGLAIIYMFGGAPPWAPTPWVVPADRYSVQCVRANGAHVLMATGDAQSRQLNASPDATWGLHLADGNIALGDLVALVNTQAAAYGQR